MNKHKHMLTDAPHAGVRPQDVGLEDVPLERLFYMTFLFGLLEKQNGNNEVPLFLRVDLRYYSLLSHGLRHFSRYSIVT
jgi:hypothetical protein